MRAARVCLYSLLLLLAVSCGGKEEEYERRPAVQVSVVSVTRTEVTLAIKSANTDSVFALCTGGAVPDAAAVVAEGYRVDGGTITLGGLTPGRNYTACVAGVWQGRYSSVETETFLTENVSGDLYPWEAARSGVPEFADLTLCPGGGRPNSNYWFSIPAEWDAVRFAPHVSFTGDDGTERWLFEGFLAISGTDMQGNTYCINNNGSRSADKASWEALLSYWLDKEGAFAQLDKAVGEAVARIGNPPGKRHVVLTLPDPVMFEYYSDKSSSTTYWGSLEGRQLDFSRIDDQITALEWYVDEARHKFAMLAPEYLQLSGFYIISEELVAEPAGYNYRYKRWDRILPPVAEYLHLHNEGLYWIPYLGADGTRKWKELGIDMAWLQPNYFWDYNGSKPIAKSVKNLADLGMGIELEFEYSMVGEVMSIPGIKGPLADGTLFFTSADVPSLRDRFREYMSSFTDAGLYGKRPIALYSGSNAMYQLGTSANISDIAMYRELCDFIADNPLKQ